MAAFPDYYRKSQVRFWGIRLLICGVLFFIYVLIWRPLRVNITQQLVYPRVQYFEDNQVNYSSSLEAGSLVIDYDYGQKSKQLYYRPEFGFFFLVSFMVLLFITRQKRHYLLLAGLHLIATILASLFLLAGAVGMPLGFIFTDIISGYLTPALTLALPPLIVTGVIDTE